MFSVKNSILIVDDDPTIRNVLLARLGKRDGLNVLLAENGEQCLKMAMKNQPVLILLDWLMPGISGLEALQTLKGDQKTASIPVYMLTEKSIMGDIEQAFEAGAEGYFTKPFKINELSEQVIVILNDLKNNG